MKTQFTEEQIAYALHEGQAGTSVADICRKRGSANRGKRLLSLRPSCRTGTHRYMNESRWPGHLQKHTSPPLLIRA